MSSKIYQTKSLTEKDFQQLGQRLKNGELGILPTDTIYGISTSAFIPQSVEKIYTLRKRNTNKPLIVLIHQINDLPQFSINLSNETKKILDQVWPGKVSVILPLKNTQFSYLHRGTNSLAFRLPDYQTIQNILIYSGPIVSPSANFEGEPPAKNVKEAEKYFNDKVNFYLGSEKEDSQPSTVVKLENNKLQIIRQGAARVPPPLTV